MKNNFSNFIKIISIIIGIVLLFSLAFYIITRSDVPSNNITHGTNLVDENISLIEEELTTIFAYINNARVANDTSCLALGNDLGYNISNYENFFTYYAPVIMDCIYEKGYPTLQSNANISYKIISLEEYNIYTDYFSIAPELSLVADVYTPDIFTTISETDATIIQNYIDNNYLIAYSIPTLVSKNNINYEIKRIFKEDDHYKAVIIASYNNEEYKGILNMRVIDNHIQYSELIFY